MDVKKAIAIARQNTAKRKTKSETYIRYAGTAVPAFLSYCTAQAGNDQLPGAGCPVIVACYPRILQHTYLLYDRYVNYPTTGELWLTT